MRIRPLDMSEWSPKILAKLASIGRVHVDDAKRATPDPDGAERKSPPGMLNTVVHHPDLVEPFLDFANVIAYKGSLPRRESELLALRVAWNCRSEFEWGHHVDYARDAGLSDGEIARIPAGPSAEGWSDIQRALLEAADELHTTQNVSDDVWAKLAGVYSEKQLIEVLFVVGEYTMLSMVVNASGVTLEPGFDPLPEDPLA